jgi:hypothetical protein
MCGFALAGPSAFAQTSEVSDILTIYNPAGAIDTQLTLFEDGSVSCIVYSYVCGSFNANPNLGTEDPNALYYIGVPVDFTQQPVTVAEAGGTWSDVFAPGYFLGVGDVLYFQSDTETTPPSLALTGNPPFIIESEDNGPMSATNILSPDLQADGWTATFWSDPEVPEPASLTLLAVGLAGLGMALRLRRT